MNDSDKTKAIFADGEAHRDEIVEVKSSLMNLHVVFLILYFNQCSSTYICLLSLKTGKI